MFDPLNVKSVMAVGVLLLLSACVSTPERAPTADAEPVVSRNVTGFETALANGNYATAVAGLRSVVKAHPDHVAAKLLLAHAYLGLGDVAPARQLYSEANRQATAPSQRVAALNGVGLTQLYDGELAAAERSFLEVLALVDRSADAWNGLAQSLDRQGRRDEAETAARRAVELAPGSHAARNNLGLILLHQGDYAEAEQVLAAAFALDASSAVAANNLRLSIAMQGRYGEALAGIAPAAEADALNNVGYAALVRGDFGAADRFLRRATEASPAYHRQAHENLRFLEMLQQRDQDAS